MYNLENLIGQSIVYEALFQPPKANAFFAFVEKSWNLFPQLLMEQH